MNDKAILPEEVSGSAKANTAGRGAPRAPESCVFSSLEDARSDSAESTICQHFLSGCIWDNNETLINWFSGRRSADSGDQNMAQQGGWRVPGHTGHPGCYFILFSY